VKFWVGDIITLSFSHSLFTDPIQIATVISLDTKNGVNIVELMWPDGYNDTYWECQVELLCRQDDTKTVQ
jgi:hypothetical protein